MNATGISIAQVEAAVRRYWRVLMEKSVGEMEKFYSSLRFSGIQPVFGAHGAGTHFRRS